MGKKYTISSLYKDLDLIKTNETIKHVQDYVYNSQKNIYGSMYKDLEEDELKSKIYQINKDTIESMASNISQGFNFKNIKNVKKLEDLKILKSLSSNGFKKQKELVSKYSNKVDKIKPFFNEMAGFNEVVTDKENTPKSLLKQTLDLTDKISHEYVDDKMIMSRNQAINAIKTLEDSDSVVIFDFETLAGQNEDGVKTFKGITEFAFGVYDKVEKDGLEKLENKEMFSSIVGVDEDTSTSIINKYVRLKNKNEEIPDDIKVAITAFGKMGHENTKIQKKEGTKSLYDFTSYASDEDSKIHNVENIIKGAKLYSDIYKEQQESLTEEGIPEIEKYFIEGVKNLKEMPSVGYNIIRADIPWAKQQIKMFSKEGQKYAYEVFGEDELNIPSENVLDVLGLIDIREKLGESTLDFYDDSAPELKSTINKRKTYRQQETLFGHLLSNKKNQEKYGVSTSGLTAHAAKDDVETLARAYQISDFKDKLLEDVVNKENPYGEIINENIEDYVFLNTQTRTFGKYHQDGPLSFTYDPKEKNFKTFMGHEVKKDGTIIPQFSDFGRKKDSLIKIENVKKIKPTDEFIDTIKPVMPEYAQDDLYSLEISNYSTKENHKGERKHTVLLFNTMEELQAQIDTFLPVGKYNEETKKIELVKGKQGEVLKEKLTKFKKDFDEDGKETFIKKDLKSFEDIVKDSEEKIRKSSSSNLVNNMSYGKYKNIKQVFNQIQGLSNDPVTSNEDIIDIAYNSDNEVIEKAIKASLGFVDRDLNKKILYDETFDNIFNSLDELKGMQPIYDTIEEYVDKRFSKDKDKDKNFVNLHKAFKTELSSMINNNNEVAKKILDSNKVEKYAKDLNYIEVDTSKYLSGTDKNILLTNQNIEKLDSDLLKINLGHNAEYELVNKLLDNTGELSTSTQYNKDIKAMTQLDKLLKGLTKDKDFKGAIDLDRYYEDDKHKKFKYDNAEVLSKILIEDLRSFKEEKEDPLFGIKNIPSFTNFTINEEQSKEFLSEISKNYKSLDNFMDRVIENKAEVIPLNKIAKDEDKLKKYSKDIAKKTLFGKKSKDDLLKEVSEYGYSEEHLKYLSKNLESTVDTVSENIAKIISNGSEVGIDLMYDKEGTLLLEYQNEIIPLDNMPKIKHRDGNLVTSIGNMDTVLSTVIMSDETYDDKVKSMRVGTTIEDAFNKTFNPAFSMVKNKKDPEKIVYSLKHYNKQLGQNLREAPAITSNHLGERWRMWEVDYTELIDKLPYFYDKGYFDDTEWADKEFVEYVLENENFDAYSMMGSDREIIAKNIDIAVMSLKEKAYDDNVFTPELEDETFLSLLSNFSMNVPEKSLSENIGQFGHMGINLATVRGDNVQRPVPYQKATSREFRESYLRESIKKHKDQAKHMSLGGVFRSDHEDAFKSKHIRGISESVESDVLIKKENLSTIDLRTLLIDEMIDRAEEKNKDDLLNLAHNEKIKGGIEDLLSKKDSKIFRKLLSTEIFEDGLIADQVIFDMFGKTEEQTVNLYKPFSLKSTDENNLELVKKLNNLIPKIEKDENGKYTVSYGDQELVDGKEKSFLSLAGFGDEAIEAYGSKFKKGMLSFQYRTKTGDIKVEEDEIQDYINNVLLEENEDLSLSEIQNKLREAYNFKAVMSNVEKQTYFKVFMDSGEKGMIVAPAFKVGEFDEDVRDYFENHQDENIRELKGLVLDLDYFDDLIGENFKASDKFKTKEDLKEALEKEQTAAMREFFGDGETKGMLGEKGVNVVGPSGSPKHSNFWMDFEKSVELLVSDIMEQEGLSKEEATQKAFNELKDKDILQINGAYYKDGKIILPSTPNKDREKGIDYINRKKMKDLLKERELYFEEKDKDGKVIKHVGQLDSKTGASISYPTLSKATDFDRPSYSRIKEVDNENIRQKRSQLEETYRTEKSLKREIEGIKKSAAKEGEGKELKLSDEALKLIAEKEEVIKRIKDSRKTIREDLKREKQTQRFFDRPAKIGDRELFTLRLNRANDASISAFQEKIDSGVLSEEKAKDMLGHMYEFAKDKSGRTVISGVKEDYKNESMLKYSLETLKHKAFNKYADLSLEDALATDYEKYKHLEPLQESLEKRGIKADRRSAEEMYELANTYKATLFNKDERQNLKKIKSQGFEEIDLLDMAVPNKDDAEFIRANKKSFLTDNLVVDLGEEFEKETGRYLAIPKLDRVSGDQAIKYEHQKVLSGLQRSFYDYKKAIDEGSEQEVEESFSNVVSKVESFKENMSKDLTTKKGLMQQMSEIQLDSAFMGKTSSIVNIDLDTILDEEHGREYTKEVTEKLKKSKIRIDRGAINFDDLNVAMFDGKSLMEHSEEGTNISASFLSREAFEDMGYFDEGYLQRVAKEKHIASGSKEAFDWSSYKPEDKEALKEEVEEHLKVHGLDSFTVRYPTIKTGSIIPSGVYMSDELHGSIVKITAPQQLAMEGDNDGDLVRSFMFRDREGRDSFLNKISGEESIEFKEIAATRMYRGMTTDAVWQKRVEEGAQKEFANAYEEGKLLSLRGDKVIDDKIFSSLGVEKTKEGVEQAFKDWANIEEDILESFEDIKTTDDIDYDVLDRYLDKFEEASDEREKIFNTMAFHSNIVSANKEALNKYKKLSIGEANVPLYNIRQYAEIEAEAKGYDDSDYARLMALQVVADEAEQSVISSKKSMADYAFVNRSFREATNNAIYKNDSQGLRTWLDDNIDEEKLLKQIEVEDSKGTFDEFFKSIPSDIDEEEINKQKVDILLDVYSNSVADFDSDGFNKLAALNRQGASIASLSVDQITKGLQGVVEEDNSTKNLVLDILQESYDISEDIEEDRKISDIVLPKSLKYSSNIDYEEYESDFSYSDNRELLRDQMTTGDYMMNTLTSVHNSVSRLLEDKNSRSLAVGALGIAATTMMIGSLVGNPTLNAGSEEKERGTDPYYSDALMDDDLSMYQTQEGGYVINLNGSSNKNSKQIQSAVASAMSGGAPVDINMSMNINDDTAEITEKYIEDMLSSMI